MNTSIQGGLADIAHIEALCNYSDDILIALSKDFVITSFNHQAEKVYSLPVEDVLGKRYDKICEHNKINFKELIDSVNGVLSNKSQTFIEENLYDRVFIKWKIIPVNAEKKNKFIILLVGRNVSEYYKFNDELIKMRLESQNSINIINDIKNSIAITKNDLCSERNTRISLENLLAHMPGNVYWMDKSCIQLGCNNNVLSMLGMSREKYIGKTYEELSQIVNWPDDLAEKLKRDDIEVMRTGLPKFNIEDPPLPHANGTFLHLLTSRVPLRDAENNIIGVAGISIDITERKETEQELLKAKEAAEAANQAKTEFVQNMQHDIRTPTAGLWGMLDYLVKSEPDSDRREALKMGLTASKRLLDLCNDAVEFGDISGNSRLKLEKHFDLRKLAKSVVELNLPATFTKDLVIRFKVDTTVPPHIISDEFRISRILINLLGNAVKFSNEGEIALSIKANIDKENTRYGVLVVEIKDTGIGISADKINNIYEKFTRAVASNTNKYPGTGLGLYVVKTFVDDLGGDIEVESHEHEGAYFKVCIPFKVPLEDMKEPGVAVDENFSSSLKEAKEKGERIQSKDTEKHSGKTPFSHELLIIEDDKLCLFGEKALLYGYTHKIDSAETVAEALQKLSEKRYDLIISDLGLPDGSGNDIVSKIKSDSNSPNHKTPFVAMTAHQDAEKHQQAMRAGFTETNTKPLGIDKAVELLRAYPAQGTEVEEEAEEEGLAVIDLALGMQRIGANTEEEAMNAMSVLYKTLQIDIPALRKAQENNDILETRDILHKVKGGLCYSGTPRLEEAIKLLHADVKRTSDLSKISDLFSLVYHETNLVSKQFKELIGRDKK